MVWAFALFAGFAACLVKLGAMTVWVAVLSAAAKSLGLLCLIGALAVVALVLRRRLRKH